MKARARRIASWAVVALCTVANPAFAQLTDSADAADPARRREAFSDATRSPRPGRPVVLSRLLRVQFTL